MSTSGSMSIQWVHEHLGDCLDCPEEVLGSLVICERADMAGTACRRWLKGGSKKAATGEEERRTTTKAVAHMVGRKGARRQ